jgi:hypothetical protein
LREAGKKTPKNFLIDCWAGNKILSFQIEVCEPREGERRRKRLAIGAFPFILKN